MNRAWIFFVGALAACSANASNTEAPRDASGDVAADDAVTTDDGNEPTDGVATTDAGIGDVPGDGATACRLSYEGASMNAYCDGMQIAVLQDYGGGPRVRLSALLMVGDGGCASVEQAEIRRGTAVVQRIVPVAAPVRPLGASEAWVEWAAEPMLVAACADDAPRFEAFGVYLTGHSSSGPFTAQCALRPGEGRYPPMTTLTCHRGLAAPPVLASASVMVNSFMGMSFTLTQASLFFPRGVGPTITDANATVRLIPAQQVFATMPLVARDTTGWMTNVSQGSSPGLGDTTQILLSQQGDPFGVDYCPPPVTMPGPMTPGSPVFLMRVSGHTAEGAFTSEVYTPLCTRNTLR